MQAQIDHQDRRRQLGLYRKNTYILYAIILLCGVLFTGFTFVKSLSAGTFDFLIFLTMLVFTAGIGVIVWFYSHPAPTYE